ncbi:MAG: sigma-E processing peptidase SpoIIGA [Oscillospiraceae bacterium]|nr:sigma-E processing peptidase SpoIIGA [Oscillospiraceae bacterium]
MPMTIYLDVLLLSNLWADYALLRTAARLTHTPLGTKRGLAGALTGAASALTILLPPLPLPVCLGMRMLLALAVCAAAFGIRNPRHLLRQTAVFLAVSLFFCGFLYLLAMLRKPSGWYVQNAVIYADISMMTLLLGTAAASAVSVLLARRNASAPQKGYSLHLRIGGNDHVLPALADTGNLLRDAFTGKPVVICPASAFPEWLRQYPDAESAAASCKGFRMLPVQSVTGQRLLPAFQPEYAAVQRAESRSEQPVDVLIALTAEVGTPAVIPACCIR